MSKLIRFLSSRWTTTIQARDESGAVKTKKQLSRGEAACYGKSNAGRDHQVYRVSLLDGTEFTCEIPKQALGRDLLQKVCNHMDLLEEEYFGLQFSDTFNITQWLDSRKLIRKQLKKVINHINLANVLFRLRVKFYPLNPNHLLEEITRYQLFLQLKLDILHGRLQCSAEDAVELGALCLQSELGDYDSAEHTAALISQFRFVPQQTPDFEKAVLEWYKKFRGLSPAEAEMKYLIKAKQFDLYGVNMHSVLGRDGNPYSLGLTPSGVLVFEGTQRIGLFVWPKITKVQCRKERLVLEVLENDDQGCEQIHTFVFRLSNNRSCKQLWKSAVEHHVFFRLSGAAPHHNPRSRGSSFRSTSSMFRSTNSKLSSFEGRMEREMNSARARGGGAGAMRSSTRRRTVSVIRRPSQRYSPRPPHSNHVSMQQQQQTRRTVASSTGVDGLRRPRNKSAISYSRSQDISLLAEANGMQTGQSVPTQRVAAFDADKRHQQVFENYQIVATLPTRNTCSSKNDKPFQRSTSTRSISSRNEMRDRERSQERRRSLAVQQHYLPELRTVGSSSIYPSANRRPLINGSGNEDGRQQGAPHRIEASKLEASRSYQGQPFHYWPTQPKHYMEQSKSSYSIHSRSSSQRRLVNDYNSVGFNYPSATVNTAGAKRYSAATTTMTNHQPMSALYRVDNTLKQVDNTNRAQNSPSRTQCCPNKSRPPHRIDYEMTSSVVQQLQPKKRVVHVTEV